MNTNIQLPLKRYMHEMGACGGWVNDAAVRQLEDAYTESVILCEQLEQERDQALDECRQRDERIARLVAAFKKDTQ